MNKELLQQTLYGLEDSARLLGATQAKKGYGVYMEQDARFEVTMHEVIAKHRKAIEAAIAQPMPATSAKPEQTAVSDAAIGDALLAWAGQRGYSDIEKMRAALTSYAATSAKPAQAEPEWIDDPHDIEQGMMRNPKWKQQAEGVLRWVAPVAQGDDKDAQKWGLNLLAKAQDDAMGRAALAAFNGHFYKCTPSCTVKDWTTAWKQGIAFWGGNAKSPAQEGEEKSAWARGFSAGNNWQICRAGF